MTSSYSARACRALSLCFALALGTQLSSAATVSYSGTFFADDQLFSQAFTLNTAGLVTVNTLSYSGGVNSLGDAVAAGGFAPELSLFDQSGTLIQLANATGCPSSPVDPITGFAWDACFSTNLLVGNYLLVLSQSGNDPFGPTLDDGFSQTGNPNFSGMNLGDPGAMFIDVGGAQRNGLWAFDLSTPDAATQRLPEPPMLALLTAALLGLRLSGARRRA